MKKSTPPHETQSFPWDLDIYDSIQTWSLAFQNHREHQGLDAIGYFARYALKELLRLSEQGYREPLAILVEILTGSVGEFDTFCNRVPANLQEFARRQWIWPGLLSRDTNILRSNERLISKLDLAREVGLNYSGKISNVETPAVSAALELRRIVAGYRNQFLQTNLKHVSPGFEKTAKLAKSLPPLSRKSYVAWFKAAKPAIERQFGNDYENHPRFVSYRKKGGKLSTKEKKKERGLVRREIRKAIRQAFKSIAPKE